MISPSLPFSFGGPVFRSLASCSQCFAQLAQERGCILESLPSLSFPTFSRSSFKPSSFSPSIPAVCPGGREKRPPLALHVRDAPCPSLAAAWKSRDWDQGGCRWGIGSGWRDSPGEGIQLTSPQLLEIRSLLPFLSTDCRALTFFRSPSESAAPAGLLKSMKHPPAQRCQPTCWLQGPREGDLQGC